MTLKDLENKTILILGLGREGMDSFSFLRKLFPKKILGLADQKKIKNKKLKIKNDKRIRWHLGEDYLKALKNYDVIIKSPGIPIHLPEVEKAFKERKITSQTEIFFANCDGTIIGITGTKGKSTTASLIYKILKDCPERSQMVHLVGNIGKPALSHLLKPNENKIFVYELSSHQLTGLKRSPHIAVFLNIFPEHLDYYKDFEEYVRAKQNITRWQKRNDYLIYNSEDKTVKKIAKSSSAQKIPFNSKNLFDFFRRCEKSQIFSLTSLIGEHNFQNIAAAVAVGKIFQIPSKKIIAAIREFKPLSHRLEFVGVYNGVRFYNDSLSTAPETAIAAIDALGDDIQTIILGGYDRGLNFKKLAKRILKSRLENIIFLPATGERIWQSILEESQKKKKYRGLPRCFFVCPARSKKGADYMKAAAELAYKYTKKGKVCLMSPASPSFGLFKDYKERGNLFKRYVRFKNRPGGHCQ